jgi:hypothetical protein
VVAEVLQVLAPIVRLFHTVLQVAGVVVLKTQPQEVVAQAVEVAVEKRGVTLVAQEILVVIAQ